MPVVGRSAVASRTWTDVPRGGLTSDAVGAELGRAIELRTRRWRARLVSTQRGCDVGIYRVDAELTQVPGAPLGLLAKPPAHLQHFPDLSGARKAARSWLERHPADVSIEPSLPLVAWIKLDRGSSFRASGRTAALRSPAQYVAPVQVGGPFCWCCECGASSPEYVSQEAALRSAGRHGRDEHADSRSDGPGPLLRGDGRRQRR